MNKPFSGAAEQNKEVILEILEKELTDHIVLLEIGSGTGQHAVHMAPKLPHVTWLPSDVAAALPAIHAWLEETPAINILSPIELDVCGNWPTKKVDMVYTCNTLHILSGIQVQCLFKGVGSILKAGGKFLAYGPFNLRGHYTSESNSRFDQWLQQQNSNYGIRDLEWLTEVAAKYGLKPYRQYSMPANNFIMGWISG